MIRLILRMMPLHAANCVCGARISQNVELNKSQRGNYSKWKLLCRVKNEFGCDVQWSFATIFSFSLLRHRWCFLWSVWWLSPLKWNNIEGTVVTSSVRRKWSGTKLDGMERNSSERRFIVGDSTKCFVVGSERNEYRLRRRLVAGLGSAQRKCDTAEQRNMNSEHTWIIEIVNMNLSVQRCIIFLSLFLCLFLVSFRRFRLVKIEIISNFFFAIIFNDVRSRSDKCVSRFIDYGRSECFRS